MKLFLYRSCKEKVSLSFGTIKVSIGEVNIKIDKNRIRKKESKLVNNVASIKLHDRFECQNSNSDEMFR